MNCYTVVDGQVQLGIALSQEENRDLALTLGKKNGQSGDVKRIPLSPSDPPSIVLVAGGVHLIRTAKLLQKGKERDAEFVLAKSANGLKADSHDNRALVLVEYTCTHKFPWFGSIPQPYESAPVYGFEVLGHEGENGVFRVQGLVVLKPGQYFDVTTLKPETSCVVAYEFQQGIDHFPRLACMSSEQFKVRESREKFAMI